ncbi:hypothetical protein D9M68_1001400 [compost metagenome]
MAPSSVPSMVMRPPAGRSSPESSSNREVLPEPEGPVMAMRWPAATERFTERNTSMRAEPSW